jgi:hypothetical protein
MVIHGTNSDDMPILFDTTRVDATLCRKNEHGRWYVVLVLSNGEEFWLPRYNTIKVNGVNITHEGDMEKCKKMAEIINIIIELERQDPPVDMDKFSKIGKDIPTRKNSK